MAELTEGAIERWRYRRSRGVTCVWRGDGGSGHSLAVVNDALVSAIEGGGGVVERTIQEMGSSPTVAVGVAQHWPPSFEPPSSGPFVLYQPWEFGRVPKRWVEEVRTTVDEVWAPSEAARAAFVASGVAPELVHVVPNGIDPAHFTPEGPARALPTGKSTVLLFVGGMTYRKGIDILLEAYGRAFTSDDDVCLVLKAFGSRTFYKGQTAEDAVRAFQSVPGSPELVLLDEDLSFDEIPALYRACDVLVQPYRGEGFCLPALEALACGRPVIVTDGGSTDDFVPAECGWRVPSRRVPLPDGSLPPEYELAGEGFLLAPDPEALVVSPPCRCGSVRAGVAGCARARAGRAVHVGAGGACRRCSHRGAARSPADPFDRADRRTRPARLRLRRPRRLGRARDVGRAAAGLRGGVPVRRRHDARPSDARRGRGAPARERRARGGRVRPRDAR